MKNNVPRLRRRRLITFVLGAVFVIRVVMAWGEPPPMPSDNQLLATPRLFLEERLMHVFHEPQASLAAGLLLGSRSAIPYDLKMDFKAVGLMHVVAVSGFNMVIIVTVITQVLIVFNRRSASIWALICIVFFTLMVGASAAVVRAAVMSGLRLIAWMIGRPQYAARLFIVTVAGMILWSPTFLFDDIGFQLSVGATAGLIWVSRPLSKYCSFLPERFGLRENFASTLAATLMTTPIVWYHFQTFSILSIPVNLVVVPLVPWLMLGSFLSLFFGILTALPTSYLFAVMIFIIETTAIIERALHTVVSPLLW